MKKLIISILLLLSLLWLYTNSLIFVKEVVKQKYTALQTILEDHGYEPNVFVISGKRWMPDNYILRKVGNAVKNSQHLNGLAIDVIVLDVNQDGNINENDVDIVYRILDEEIIRDSGAIGTYKQQQFFLTQQMVHFDYRGYKERWHR